MPWPMTPAINGFAASLGCLARTAPNPSPWALAPNRQADIKPLFFGKAN